MFSTISFVCLLSDVLKVISLLMAMNLCQAVSPQVQCVEQCTVLQAFHMAEVVIRTIQMQKRESFTESSRADQLVMINCESMKVFQRSQTT